ncbi:phytanoyl-CoA dioxygenase family protein [Akkermansiaceae bacterium]|nr:phytanoyl-CoA dioxygenase family protein [Akkermansiaceae bacterium]
MKYFISEPWFILREYFSDKGKVSDELKDIHRQGFTIKRNFLDQDKCLSLIDEFKSNLSNEKVWRDVVQSDTRIFGIEKKSPSFGKIFDTLDLKNIYNCYISAAQESIVLCNHIIPKAENLGSGGGWHRDSMYRRQLKFIVYLNAAKTRNGCFQYIPKSHKVLEKYRINRALSKPLGDYRYTEGDIEKLAKKNFEPVSLEGNAGDLLIVDTSGIHRGHPILEGERYAATKYMWERKVPKSIQDLLIT